MQKTHKDLEGQKSRLSASKINEFLDLLSKCKKESGVHHTAENILLEFLVRKVNTTTEVIDGYLKTLDKLQPVLNRVITDEEKFNAFDRINGLEWFQAVQELSLIHI